LFQSRSGFLLSCDGRGRRSLLDCRSVSIPFWVSTVLRREHAGRPVRDQHVSIPFWVSTVLRLQGPLDGEAVGVLFQSRSGFLLSCDSSSPSPSWGSASCFNPVLGFYCPATTGASPVPFRRGCFNPVLGFYCPATGRCATSSRTRRCFNPVLGFYCPATCSEALFLSGKVFQSRSGFLLSCDTGSPTASAGKLRVSIPFWVSTVLRRARSGSGRTVRPQFQSRSGFLLSCDMAFIRRNSSGFSRFNPVLGFYCPATPSYPNSSVSTRMFQSRSGFLLSCDHPTVRTSASRDRAFQSRSGFLLSCDRTFESWRTET